MIRLNVLPGDAVPLGAQAGDIAAWHIFEQADIYAIEAALAAQRPLLLRGEPGVGKTQLARAAAQTLGWGFRHRVVDSRTEARDLKWSEDLVARLANAQMVGALKGMADPADKDDPRTRIGLEHYVSPGPLWWGFDWGDAVRQADMVGMTVPANPAGCDPANGVVVLIDEIDKAESEVPNGLLEALGQREFTPFGRDQPVRARTWPLVVITTNEERRLPDAFVRRCVVHDMRMPREGAALRDFLVRRGRAHFPAAAAALLEKAAQLTQEDRKTCEARQLWPLPGQAEYLDLLRAVAGEPPGKAAMARLDQLATYFLRKHAEPQA